eukprot:359332-Chlamydomonas_euryale.AAC.3
MIPIRGVPGGLGSPLPGSDALEAVAAIPGASAGAGAADRREAAAAAVEAATCPKAGAAGDSATSAATPRDTQVCGRHVHVPSARAQRGQANLRGADPELRKRESSN